MKIDMEKLNDLSLMNVIFHTKKQLDYDSMEFLNLVFAREGVFLAIKSKFGIVFDKTNLPYKNKGLQPLFKGEDYIYSFESFIRKPDINVLQNILEMFKYVCGKTKEELLTIVYYDTEEDTFITDLVKTQIVSGGSVDYAYNQKYEMDERYIKYLEIHSHHAMGASFSGTDNRDESNRTLYFCGVLGKINPNTSNIFNIDHKFRIWSGSRFIEIPIHEVFNTYTDPVILTDAQMDELDNVIEISNKIKTMTGLHNQQKHGHIGNGIFNMGSKSDTFQGGQQDAVRAALENMGLDPDDPDVFDTLSELELENLPIEWQTDGKELIDKRRPN